MSPAARAPASRAPAAPAAPTRPVTPEQPASARTPRSPAAGGPPALRLAPAAPAKAAAPTAAITPVPAVASTPAPAPVTTPVPVAAQPQRPAAPQREESLGEMVLWALLRRVAPDLEPILRRGIFAWLEQQITAAIRGFVNGLFAPIRAVTGVAATMTTLFQSLVDWMQEAAAKIAKGDCSSITEAVEKIEQVLSGIMSAVTDKVKALAERVSNFFTRLWDRFGAPIWEMLKQIGGTVWEGIQAFGAWVWDKIEKVRAAGTEAWAWVKDRLGIGEGPEGQNGLVQWIKAKAEEVWNWLKPRIEPYQKQLTVIAAIVLALSPAGPLLAIGAGVAGVVYGIKWIREHLRKRDDVVAQRGVFERTILPPLMRGMEAVGGALKSVSARVAAKLGEAAGAIGQFAGSLATSLLGFATQFIEWVAEQFSALWKWANDKLTALVEWVTTGLARLKAFLQPVLDVLRTVGEIYLDILKIPVLAATTAWNKIPACIRDPFVNFLINQVLKRIPLFKQITEVLLPTWEKVKATALPILRKVFKEGRLKDAALDVLLLVLEALEVPFELVQTVIAKGKASLDLILQQPIEFLTNMLDALKQGVLQFEANIVDHLLSGLKNWLFEAAIKAGLHPPTELTFRAVFDFILEVLGLSVDKVLERLELKIGPEKMAKIKKALAVVSKIWEWLSKLFDEGPQGVWKKLTEKLGDLWQSVIDAAVGYITKTVTKVAIPKLTAMIAGGPIGAVINGLIAIWKALQTFAKQFKRILEIMNGVFDTIGDIARGAIAGAANMVENLMDRVLPIIIAFLADQLSLGDISERIEEMLVAIRAKVVEAIDWLIDKALAIGGAILGLVKAGIAKVLEWWKEAKKFTLDGTEHTLKFQGESPDGEVVVESSPPKLLGDFLATRKKEPMDEDQETAFKEIVTHKQTIEKLKAKTKGGFGKEDGETISKALAEIAKLLPALGHSVLPRTELVKQEVQRVGSAKLGKKIWAKPLSLEPGALSGSEPHETNEIWDAVSLRRDTYVRGHLLNHHVHGPGENYNLAPITIAANNEMAREVESHVKDEVLTHRKIVEYRVTMEYKTRSPERVFIDEENELPTGIELEAYEIEKDKKTKQWTAVKTLVKHDIEHKLPEPDVDAGTPRPRVNLSTDSLKTLKKIHGITTAQAKKIHDNQPYRVYQQLRDLQLPKELVDRLEEDNRVKLYEGGP
jgi:phage-related protein